MKKLSVFLCVVLSILILILPASAEETLTDLTKVYNNLSTYLYAPYVEKSEFYDEYSAMMDEIKELLKSDSITQKEISKYYNELRTAYSNLMRDVYDYTSLEVLCANFETLDSGAFTEESWKKLVSVYDSIQRELASPSLFARKKTTTEEEYSNHMKKHIASFATNFTNAFHALELREATDIITKEYLNSYTKYIRLCANEAVFSEAEGWKAFQNNLKNADALLALANPRQNRINEAYNQLKASYEKLSNEIYQDTKADELLSQYEELLKNDYSPASWARYETEIEELRLLRERTHYIFLPAGETEETCEKFISSYFETLSQNASTAHSNLVSDQLYQTLLSLCKKNKAVEVLEGLEIKYNLLQGAVEEGEAVLNNKDAITEDFNKAIENIETASENFSLAEEHLKKEQAKVIKQDKEAAKWIVISAILTILLSLISALFLSYRHFGRIDWTK